MIRRSDEGGEWLTLGVMVVLLVVLVCGLNACYNNIRSGFERDCLAAHPNAHVTGRAAKTLYCLGPNGEVWETR